MNASLRSLEVVYHAGATLVDPLVEVWTSTDGQQIDADSVLLMTRPITDVGAGDNVVQFAADFAVEPIHESYLVARIVADGGATTTEFQPFAGGAFTTTSGSVVLHGSDQDDQFLVDQNTASVTIGLTTETIDISSFDLTVTAESRDWVFVYGHGGNDNLNGQASTIAAAPIAAFGGSGNDQLTGGANDDLIDGGADADAMLEGLAGADVVIGQDGDDALHGGDGRDLLVGGDGLDSVYGEQGEDIVIGGATLYDNVPSQLLELVAAWNQDALYSDGVTIQQNDSHDLAFTRPSGEQPFEWEYVSVAELASEQRIWVSSVELDALSEADRRHGVNTELVVPTNSLAATNGSGAFVVMDRKPNGDFVYAGIVYLDAALPAVSESGFYVAIGEHLAGDWGFDTNAKLQPVNYRLTPNGETQIIDSISDFIRWTDDDLDGEFEQEEISSLTFSVTNRQRASDGVHVVSMSATGISQHFELIDSLTPNGTFGFATAATPAAVDSFAVFRQPSDITPGSTLGRITADPLFEARFATETSDAFYERVDLLRGDYLADLTVDDTPRLRVIDTVYSDAAADMLFGGDGAGGIEKDSLDWIFREASDQLPDAFVAEELVNEVAAAWTAARAENPNLAKPPAARIAYRQDNLDRLDRVSSTDIQERIVQFIPVGFTGAESGDNARRHIGSDLGIQSGGWQEFINRTVVPTVAKGVRRYQLHNPFGVWDYETTGTARMTIDQFDKALGIDLSQGLGGTENRGGYGLQTHNESSQEQITLDADGNPVLRTFYVDPESPIDPSDLPYAVAEPLPWLTDDFVSAWRNITSGASSAGQPIEVIAYIGTPRVTAVEEVDGTFVAQPPTAANPQNTGTTPWRQWVQFVNTLHPDKQDEPWSASGYAREITGNTEFEFTSDQLYSLLKQLVDQNIQPLIDAGMSIGFDGSATATENSLAFRYLDELRRHTYEELSSELPSGLKSQQGNTAYIRVYIEAIPQEQGGPQDDGAYWYTPPVDSTGALAGANFRVEAIDSLYLEWGTNYQANAIPPELFVDGFVRLSIGEGSGFIGPIDAGAFSTDPINVVTNMLSSGLDAAVRLHLLLEGFLERYGSFDDWGGDGDWFDNLSDFT